MKLYFDSLTTLKVIHAESPVVIFFGTYGMLVSLEDAIIMQIYHLSFVFGNWENVDENFESWIGI